MKVLVAYDGSEPSKKALKRAVDMTSKTGGEMTILAVTEPVCPLSATEKECSLMDATLRRETQTFLDGIKNELAKEPISIKTLVREGRPAEEIVGIAKEKKPDMIVIGSHGRHGAKKFFLGSVSLRVAERAPCSVFIVR
jgi:nucleotide-binding universal stress UspA family protein